MKDELIPTRATLLSKLRDMDNHAEWEEFYDTYSKLIHGMALKSGLTEFEAQEVVQETIIGVANKIPEYRYVPEQCSFKSWLFNMIKWRIADQFRNRQIRARSDSEETRTDGTSTTDRIPAPEPPNELEAYYEAGWENTVEKRAIDNTIKRVAPKTYQLFDFCVFKRWPAAKVAKTMNVNIGQVYLAKFRVSRMLKQEIKSLRKQGRGSPDYETPEFPPVNPNPQIRK